MVLLVIFRLQCRRVGRKNRKLTIVVEHTGDVVATLRPLQCTRTLLSAKLRHLMYLLQLKLRSWVSLQVSTRLCTPELFTKYDPSQDIIFPPELLVRYLKY